MSPIIVFFPAMIFMSFCFACLIGYFMSRKIRVQKLKHRLLIPFAVGIVIFVTGVFCTVKFASDKYKFGVLPKDVPLKLPEGACNVNYRRSWSSSRYLADFCVGENEFLNWMKDMNVLNRTNKFITDDEKDGTYWAEVHSSPYPKYARLGWTKNGSVPPLNVEALSVKKYPEPSIIPIMIKNGYYHDDYDGDSGRTIIYDSDTGRAYCVITTF